LGRKRLPIHRRLSTPMCLMELSLAAFRGRLLSSLSVARRRSKPSRSMATTMPMMSMRNARQRESKMEHVPVKSSNIVSVAYDPLTAAMEIKFANGGLYRMTEVMPTDHHALIHADS